MTRIFYNQHVALAGEREHIGWIANLSAQKDGRDGADLTGWCAIKRGCRLFDTQKTRLGIHIRKHHFRPEVSRRVRRRDKRNGGHDDEIAFPKSRLRHRQVQRGRPVRADRSIRRAGVFSKRTFEFIDFWARRQVGLGHRRRHGFNVVSFNDLTSVEEERDLLVHLLAGFAPAPPTPVMV